MFMGSIAIQPASFLPEVFRMKSHCSGSCLLSLVFAFCAAMQSVAPIAAAKGGEPQYFAIRGAKVVPVSGPSIEDATVVVARGVILAVGKDVAIPADAWV